MSSGPSTINPTIGAPRRPSSADGPPARLSLKPDGPATGFVDGGWWPRSRKLELELPALLAALRERLGHIESVSYHLGDWEAPPRRVDVADGSVRVAGYRLQRAGTLDVIARHRRVTLLVVGSEHRQDIAQQALAASAGPDNTDDIDTLLAHLSPATIDKNEDRS